MKRETETSPIAPRDSTPGLCAPPRPCQEVFGNTLFHSFQVRLLGVDSPNGPGIPVKEPLARCLLGRRYPSTTRVKAPLPDRSLRLVEPKLPSSPENEFPDSDKLSFGRGEGHYPRASELLDYNMSVSCHMEATFATWLARELDRMQPVRLLLLPPRRKDAH